MSARERLGVQLKVFLAGRVAVEADGVLLGEERFPGRQGRLLFPQRRDGSHERVWCYGLNLPEGTWVDIIFAADADADAVAEAEAPLAADDLEHAKAVATQAASFASTGSGDTRSPTRICASTSTNSS